MGTRDGLLDAALQVFSRGGADGGSMREISRVAGVNVSAAYYHFGSKRELLLAIFRERGLLDFPDPADLTPGPGGSPVEALTEIFLGAWALLDGAADVVKLALHEAMKGDDDARAFFDEWREQGDAFIRATLIHRGVVDETDADRLAVHVRHVIWGVFTEALMRGTTDRVLAETARQTAELLLGES